jgi:hypothetical protein
MSNQFTDAVINTFLEQYGVLWLSLHYDDPGIGTYHNYEVSGGSYTRKSGTFTAPTSRTIWLDNPVLFNGLPATALTHVGFWTDQYAGTLVAVATVPNAPVSIAVNGSYSIAQNGVSLSIS